MSRGKQSMNPLIYLNIKARLILFLSIMLLTVCSTLSFIVAYHTIEVLDDDLQKRGLSEATNLAVESKFGTLTEDAEILKQLLNNKLINPDILFIEVINNEKVSLASVYRFPPSSGQLSKTNQSHKKTDTLAISNVSSSFTIKE